MFYVWEEENIYYYAFVWLVSTWLAHDMFAATVDFSTIWTVKLSSLSRISGTWCFHQSYSMIMCGFHHIIRAHLENDEL